MHSRGDMVFEGGRRVALLPLIAIVATACGGPAGRPNDGPGADAATWNAILAVEDARPLSADSLAPLRDALASPEPAVRRLAARAIGRLERDTPVPLLVPLLDDSVATVRAEAANALGQAVSRGDPALARSALRERAGIETDAVVVGTLAETLGRLTVASDSEAATAASTIAGLAVLAGDTTDARVLGGVRGLFFLARQPASAGAFPDDVRDRLRELAAYGRVDATDPSEALAVEDGSQATSAMRPGAELRRRRVRTLAAAALVGAGAADPADLAAALTDPDPLVRREALPGLTRMIEGAPRDALLDRTLGDASPVVRTDALAVLGRLAPGADHCGRALDAANDSSVAVRLVALDLLADCGALAAAVDALDRTVAELYEPGATGEVGRRTSADWHAGAHALVALARAAPARARIRIDPFAVDASPFVRTYAARAAAAIGDEARLRALAADTSANVRTAAIEGLSAVAGHGADSIYLAALRATDSQLVQAGAHALEGTTSSQALPALLEALDRITARRRETERDARMALLERIASLGDSAVERLRPYLRDYDPAVAARAAELLMQWTGEPQRTLPEPLPRQPLPTFDELSALQDARVTIALESGDSIMLRLLPWLAPTNAARFARLARAGYYDGLTFHRVVPNFVVQGGSPHGNEFAGDGPFTRDELGRTGNWRGTVGLSTRGRDTGDAQLYINLVDNIRLDHQYTVFAEVLCGMDAVDRLQEGAVMQSVVVH